MRPRVLVVDEDPASCELIVKVLGRHCDLHFLADPLRVFDALEILEPDLTILELALGTLNGLELLGLIRDAGPAASVRTMVFSAVHDLESQKMVYRLGARHFLAKPCRPSQLFKAAVQIARHAIGECAAKRLDFAAALALLAEREQSGQLHPLARVVGAVHDQRRHQELASSSIMGTIAARRPAE
jgi:PleD family two-component response regulator